MKLDKTHNAESSKLKLDYLKWVGKTIIILFHF